MVPVSMLAGVCLEVASDRLDREDHEPYYGDDSDGNDRQEGDTTTCGSDLTIRVADGSRFASLGWLAEPHVRRREARRRGRCILMMPH